MHFINNKMMPHNDLYSYIDYVFMWSGVAWCYRYGWLAEGKVEVALKKFFLPKPLTIMYYEVWTTVYIDSTDDGNFVLINVDTYPFKLYLDEDVHNLTFYYYINITISN